jgi:hypothetical protein
VATNQDEIGGLSVLKKILIFGFGAISTLADAQSAPSGLAPGKWEEKLTMQITKTAGQATEKPPQISTEANCYTDQDVADPKRMFLAGAETDCTLSNFSMSGGRIGMSATCSFAPDVTMSGNFQGNYTSTSYGLRGVMSSQGANPTEVTASMSARRVDVCRK